MRFLIVPLMTENNNSIDLQHLLQNNEEYNIKVNKIKDYINNMKKK